MKNSETKLVINIIGEDGSQCEITRLSQKSGKNFVSFDLEDLGNQFKNKMGRTFNVHTHISANAGYFIFENSKKYSGEIKFASLEDIQSLSINKELYNKAINTVLSNQVPGFNLSPPSTTDFKFLIHQMDKHPFLEENYSVVVTSGGLWVYRISRDEKTKALDFLGKVDFLANAYNLAHSPKTKASTRRTAKYLLKMNFKNDETQKWFSVWKEAALLTRAPYSKEALNVAIYEGDLDLVKAEYLLKVKAANALSSLLKQHGVEIFFVPISEVH